MRISKTRDYAIVTGDVVRSSGLSVAARKKLRTALGTASKRLRSAFRDDVPLSVDVFRGDSWQFVVVSPVRALRVALFYRAALIATAPKGVDTRMAIAIGRVDFIPERVSEGDGPAYRLSGRELDALGSRRRMSFAAPDDPAEECLATLVAVLDGLVSRWTPAQARAVAGALRGWSQTDIARKSWKPPISQQAVAQNLAAGSWIQLEIALDFAERSLAGTPKQV